MVACCCWDERGNFGGIAEYLRPVNFAAAVPTLKLVVNVLASEATSAFDDSILDSMLAWAATSALALAILQAALQSSLTRIAETKFWIKSEVVN